MVPTIVQVEHLVCGQLLLTLPPTLGLMLDMNTQVKGNAGAHYNRRFEDATAIISTSCGVCSMLLQPHLTREVRSSDNVRLAFWYAGRRPYDGLPGHLVLSMVADGEASLEFPPDCMDWYRKLSEMCRRQEPQDRPTFKRIMAMIDSLQV